MNLAPGPYGGAEFWEQLQGESYKGGGGVGGESNATSDTESKPQESLSVFLHILIFTVITHPHTYP